MEVNKIEGTHLGQKSEYKFSYDPSLLVPVPRQENRSLINVDNRNLPFIGYDIWNCYEISCLLSNGKPFVGIAKIKYSCNSEFLVESKSLKLYLNSFNMTCIKANDEFYAKRELEEIISSDLGKVLQTVVQVSVFGSTCTSSCDSILSDCTRMKYLRYIDFEEIVAPFSYTEDPSLLKVLPMGEDGTIIYQSDLLRSNCKITKQPDWGTIYIGLEYKERVLKMSNLLKYIISFRNENHFHEEICETIYKRLYDVLDIQKEGSLIVACFYTRRGGIDINPIRASNIQMFGYFRDYLNIDRVSPKTLRQ